MKPYQLDENYRIFADTDSYALQHLIKNGKQGLRWKSFEWHVSLDSLLKSYLTRLVRESDRDMHYAIEDSVSAVRGAVERLGASLTVVL